MLYSGNGKKITGLGVALMLGMIASLPIIQAEAVQLDVESCISCHSTLKHKEVVAFAAKSCTECHNQPEITGEKNRVSAHLDALAEVDLPVVTSTKDLPAGMSLPPYYKGSRLGKAPNEMVAIPAGDFIRGTNDRLPDEGPQHTGHTDAYWIDKYEVTNLQYKAFVEATKRKSPKHFRNRTYLPGKADHPVVYVTWHDAHDYCEWAGKRLPTDAEWEKAGRGTDGRMYPWGSEFKMHAANTPQRWKSLQEQGDTMPVGSFAEGISPYGVYDMSGNVWEWTASRYAPYPGNMRITENYDENYKTLKGGSWWDCSFYKCGISAPLFNRSFFLMTTKNESFGFRCAKDGVPTAVSRHKAE